MKYKYIVTFPIPEPSKSEICALMDRISSYTKTPPYYEKLPPHITFHRPIEGVEEKVIKNLVESMTLQIRQTRITVSHLYPFGKEYIVMPVHATQRLCSFWVGLNNLLSSLPEYQHGEFDHDNTIHMTVAEKTSKVFDSVWGRLKDLAVDAMTIPVKKVEIHRKMIVGSKWEKLVEYQIPE